MNEQTQTRSQPELDLAAASPRAADEPPIVFFDGVCNLCNRSVSWLIWLDSKHRRLRFAPLQGETASQLFTQIGQLPDDDRVWSMMLWDRFGLSQRSDAALRVLWHIGGVWRFVSYLLFLFPRFLRDAVYRFIARSRYRWFGKHQTCRIPSAEERAQFLP